jgi:hypothetical protein
LVLQVDLVWAMFVVMPRFQQYVLDGVELVVLATATIDVMEGDTWAWSARARASSLATNAACVLASVMAMLDTPWYLSVPEVLSRRLSVSAALKWS